MAWASTHLTQAGLITKPQRGISRITDRGRTVLREHPDRIDLPVLEGFAEYQDFRRRSSARRKPRAEPPERATPDQTPEESIEAAYDEARAALEQELLQRVLEHDDRFFEDLVLDVLVTLGYGGSKEDAAERVGRSGDGGIDGVIREDRLGLDAIYVQAKRWDPSRTVGPREIREFAGALQDVEASKGVFITTSTLSDEARELGRRRRIVLIDGEELASLMIDAGVGVSTTRRYELKRVDEDYFAGEA